MSITVDFYTYSKKRNSTAVPASGAISYSCELKEETSCLNPVIRIAVSSMPVPTVAPTIYNYAHISSFQRWYFISDWTYTAGVWEASLQVDVLGSNRTGIGNTTCYIERCSSTYNGNIMDNLYPAKTDFDITHVTCGCMWYNINPNNGGCYILGVISAQYTETPAVGAVSYYACTQPQIKSVIAYLFGDSIYNSSSITEISSGLYKSFFNPFQYVVSCIWFPFDITSFGSTTTQIRVGYWNTGISAIQVSARAQKTFLTATIPDHPQASSRGNYLNHAPYTKLTLYCAPFGVIPVDVRYTEIGNYLYCPVWVDHVTGEATIRVNITQDSSHLTTGAYITERTATIGVPIQLAQVMNEYSHSASGILSDVLAEGVMSVIGASVGSSINCSAPTVTTSGANGGFINAIMDPVLVVEHARITDGDNTNLGRPLMSTRQISTIPGYIKAINPPISLAITESEIRAIREIMENGFYYE